MPHKPDIPCSRCGELLWRGTGSTSSPVCRLCRLVEKAPYGSLVDGVRRILAEDERRELNRRRQRERRAQRPRPASAPAPRKPPTPRPCVDCGSVITEPAARQERCTPCGARRRRETHASTIRRRDVRIRSNGVTEVYTLTEIAQRDRFVCQLCRKRVAMTRGVPHPKAPTIDHIVPVSEGGPDTRANVQLAHFWCNTAKGNRGSQQLALVG